MPDGSVTTFGRPLGQSADAFGGECGVDRVGLGRPHRVDAVRERVQARRDAHRDREGDGEGGVVDDDLRQYARVGAGGLAVAFGQAPHRGRLGARVSGWHGDDRQAGGQGDRLRQAGGGAAADADERVRVVPCRGFAGAGGHLDRDVHHHVVVPVHDAQVPGDAVRDVRFLFGRDHHDPAGAEGGDLVLEVGGGLAGAEADPLREGVVDEAHALYLPAQPISSKSISSAR